MTLYDTVIKNGVICTASEVYPADIAISDGKIALVGSIDESLGAEVIDAEGAYITPGGVDAHVHLNEPSQIFGNVSDNVSTGSRSAVAGGTTTMVTFAVGMHDDAHPAPFTRAVAEFIDAVDDDLYCDYSVHMVVTKADRAVLDVEFPKLIELGVTSIKMYMTYPRLQMRDGDLMSAMLMARKHGITTMLHAENGDMVEWMINELEAQGKTDPYYHAVSRPTKYEGEATNRAIIISETMDNPILFVHVSAPEAVNCIREAQTRGIPIFAETCPQYLMLSADDLKCCHGVDPFEGAKFLCSPPPRHGEADRQAIWQGCRNGTFTIMSSDHCPTMYAGEDGKRAAFKDGHNGEFRWVPNGCPGLETRLPLMWNYGVLEDKLPMQKFVEILCTNPAKLYGMYPTKGSILGGVSDADLVIWYPEGKFTGPSTIQNANLYHNCDYTPFEGYGIKNWPRYTILRGKVVYKEGKLVEKMKGIGKFVRRQKSSLATPQGTWLSEWRPDYVREAEVAKA